MEVFTLRTGNRRLDSSITAIRSYLHLDQSSPSARRLGDGSTDDDDDPLFTTRLIPLPDDGASVSSEFRYVSESGSSGSQCAWSNADPPWFRYSYPDLNPAVPSLAERSLPDEVPNPFNPDGLINIVHPRLSKRAEAAVDNSPGNVSVNGLVKFRLQHRQGDKTYRARKQPVQAKWQWLGKLPDYTHPQTNSHPQTNEAQLNPFLNPVLHLPPAFERGMHLDATDAKLFKFYEVAWCAGRTLLPGSNGFKNEVTPMASTYPCVKHAVLALASTYVLDYLPSQTLERRANLHWKRAILLLSQLLNDPVTYNPGKEDAVLVAMVLLSINDMVNWEADRAAGVAPRWLIGSRAARLLLDVSDPGYRYAHPENVQYGNVRRYMGSKAAIVEIFCDMTAPLPPVRSKCPFPWLLEGTEREIRMVEGLNGLCPKLLHTYAQITHLSSRLAVDPHSIVIPKAARVIERRLHNFRQWSEYSEGYPNTDALLNSCILDPTTNQVTDPFKVIELIAECYVLSAQLYLQCRLLRMPRTAPVVQKINARLLKCIDYMPATGPTYTAMVPLLSIWVSATVAMTVEDRAVINRYYKTCLKRARGTGPPAAYATFRVWYWQDHILAVKERDDIAVMAGEGLGVAECIGNRRAWWEEMIPVVGGVLNLV